MRKVRDILGFAGTMVGLVVWDRIANFISVVMMLVAIAYVVAVALVTVRLFGAAWLLLTMPLGILLGVPTMKLMARFSQRITD